MAQLSLSIGVWFLIDSMPMVITSQNDESYILISNNGQTFIKTQQELEGLYLEGRISSALPENHFTNNRKELNLQILPGVDLDDERFEYIKAKRLLLQELGEIPWNKKLIDVGLDNFYRAHPNFIIARPHYITIWRWQKKYKNSSNDVTGLLDSRGRGLYQRWPSKTLSLCAIAIDKVYMTRLKGTVSQTLISAQGLVKLENSQRPTGMQLKPPTRWLLERLIKEIPEIDRNIARFGAPIARNMHRGKGNKVREVLFRQYSEIDFTPIDAVLIDDESHAVLGRGWIGVHKETLTKYPLGIYIGYTPPSCQSLADCLKHSLLPKINLRDEYPEIENEWEGYGPTEVIFMDNAMENHSKMVDSLVATINTDVMYCGRTTPWEKPNIEGYLKQQSKDCVHRIPGTTFSNIFEKADYPSEGCAVMTLSRFRAHLMKWIVDVYMQKKQKALNDLSPATLWKKLNERQKPIFETRALNLDLILGRVYERQVTNKGIFWEGLQYASTELIDLRALHGTRFVTEIRVNEIDISHIWVKLPVHGRSGSKIESEFIQVPAVNQKYARNMSAYMHAVNKSWAKRHHYSEDDTGWLLASNDIHDEVNMIPPIRKNKGSKKVAARLIDELRQKPLVRIREKDSSSEASIVKESLPFPEFSFPIEYKPFEITLEKDK